MCENRRKLVVWSFWLRKQALIRQNGRKMEEKRRKRENSTTSSLDKVVEMALRKICWCGVARSGSQARGPHLSFRRVCCLTASRVRCDESRKAGEASGQNCCVEDLMMVVDTAFVIKPCLRSRSVLSGASSCVEIAIKMQKVSQIVQAGL